MRRNKTLYPLVLAVVCAGATALFTSAARAGAPINLLTFDETRVGTVTNPNGSINFNFVTGGGYATVRGALLNTSNFGAGGIVSRPVNLLPTVPTLTQAALIGADVVVIPFQVTLLASEEAALNLFLNQGGGILAFHNNAAVHWLPWSVQPLVVLRALGVQALATQPHPLPTVLLGVSVWVQLLALVLLVPSPLVVSGPTERMRCNMM